MNIEIITTLPFPNGFASTNRIIAYCRGFMEEGIRSNINIISPTEIGIDNKNYEYKGVHQGISFEYLCKTTSISNKNIKSRSILKQLYKIKARYLTFLSLIRLNKLFIDNKESIFLIYIRDSIFISIYLLILKYLFHLKMFYEKNEYPFFYLKKNKRYLKQKVFLSVLKKFTSGIIVISSYLEEFFKKNGFNNIIRIPVLVNSNDFYAFDNKSENLVYCGNLSESKDGLLTIIKAFSDSEISKDQNLIIMGDTPNTIDKNNMFDEIKKSRRKDQIKYLGYVSRKKLLEEINRAKGLIFIKVENLQAEACFPSKLGEYLASGNILITNQSGEIPYYLQHNYNALLCETPEINDIKKKIELVLNTPISDFDSVRTNARKTAIDKFHYQNQVHRLINFLLKT